MNIQSKNRITGASLFLIGVIYTYLSLQLKAPSNPKDPGSALFPMVASIGLIVCGATIFFTKVNADSKPFFSSKGWVNLVMGMLAIYIVGLKYIGFLLSTPLLLFGVASKFAEGYSVSAGKRILYSVLVTLIVYLVFAKAFNVMLPKGLLSF